MVARYCPNGQWFPNGPRSHCQNSVKAVSSSVRTLPQNTLKHYPIHCRTIGNPVLSQYQTTGRPLTYHQPLGCIPRWFFIISTMSAPNVPQWHTRGFGRIGLKSIRAVRAWSKDGAPAIGQLFACLLTVQQHWPLPAVCHNVFLSPLQQL